MKVKMLVGLAGNEYSLAPGDEWEFPEAEADRLIAAEYAVRVDVAVEKAVRAPDGVERRGKKAKSDVVPSDSERSAGV